MTIEQTQATAQGDTAVVDAGTENQETTVQTESGLGAEAQGVDAEGVAEGSEQTEGEGVGEKPETEEEKFTKEYTGKPESGYDFKDVELPEGMTFNEELTDELTQLAGKYNMSQKGANELMTMGVKLVDKAQKGFLESLVKQTTDMSNKFYDALQADTEIGGNKLDETIRVANVAYNHYIKGADAEAHGLIQQSGLANNRAFIKMLRDVGERMQDGKFVTGNASKGARTASDWYPDMPKGDQ